MAASTYWADKLVIQFLSACSNRREFLKATTAAGIAISAFGGIGALSGFAGMQTTQEKITDLQREIYALMWEHKVINLSASERVARLIEILDKAISDKDPDRTLIAAEGLVPHAGENVFEALQKAYEAFPDNTPLRMYLVQLMTITFTLYPQAGNDINKFFYKELRNPSVVTRVRRSIYSGMVYLLNFSFRGLRRHLRGIRLKGNYGISLALELWIGDMIKRIYPPFEAFARFPNRDALTKEYMLRRFGRTVDYAGFLKPDESLKKPPEQERIDQEAFGNPQGKIPLWRKQLSDKELKTRIDALLNLDEIDPLDSNPADLGMLLKMLDDESESPEIKIVIVTILGNRFSTTISKDIQERLVSYLESSDNDLALAAAKALRFRAGLPADDILKILEKKKDEKVRQELGDMILSCLNSPKTFSHLVRPIIMADPKNREDKKFRVDELRMWYVRLGVERDEIVRQAIPSMPPRILKMVIYWLRNLSMINIATRMPPIWFAQGGGHSGDGLQVDGHREIAIDEDMRHLDQIAKELAVYDKNMGIVERE